MSGSKEKISAFQFFSLLYLARILTTVTYIPSYAKGTTPSDMIFGTVIRFIAGVIVMVPVFLLYKKYPEKNVIDTVRGKSDKLSKALAVIYALAFLYFTVSTVARLDVFAGTVIFPETNVNYLLVFILIICCYGAYLGLEAIGRSAVLSLIAVLPAMIFVAGTLTKNVDLLNFSPLFYNGVTPVLRTSLNAVGRTVEFIMTATALPRVTGNVKKGFIVWITAQNLTASFLFFLAAGVMGNFTETQLFPLHTLASIAQFSMFERLDAVITCVWILCAFLKISFLIYLAVDLLRKEFAQKNPVLFLLPTGVLISAVNLYTAQSIDRFMAADNSYIKLGITAVTVFIIPSIILLGDKICAKHHSSSQ